MPKKELPVLQIEQFDHAHGSYRRNEQEFYANTISEHLKHHHFIHTPHKHDFFLCMLFTRGKGTHEIDFTAYPVKPGSVFVMSPGQTHNWKLSKDIEGYIFFHSRDFYELDTAGESLKSFPFFQSLQASPSIQANGNQAKSIAVSFAEILAEFEYNKAMKMERLHALVRLMYIDLSRICIPGSNTVKSAVYLNQLRMVESLIERHYKTKKLPKEYAALMHISEKHLNRICKTSLDKTSTELIADRVLLEAKRLLAQTKLKVADIAAGLGYEDSSYFIRFFRKNTGETPAQFMKRYRS